MSDTQDRAREAAIKRCMADCYDVPLEKSQLANECKNAALSMIAALTAAELRIVDADADDRRTEDVRRLVEFVEQWDKEQVMTDFAMTRSGKDGWIAMRDARASVESIIERVREREAGR